MRFSDLVRPEDLKAINHTLVDQGLEYDIYQHGESRSFKHRKIRNVRTGALRRLLADAPPLTNDLDQAKAAWSHWMALATQRQAFPDGNHRTAFIAFNKALHKQSGRVFTLTSVDTESMRTRSKVLVRAAWASGRERIVSHLAADIADRAHPSRLLYAEFEAKLTVEGVQPTSGKVLNDFNRLRLPMEGKATAPRCQAQASHANGVIPGMSGSHRCRSPAKRQVTIEGESFTICGVHANALKTTYRPGRRGGRVSFGIKVIRGDDYLDRGEIVRVPADTPTMELAGKAVAPPTAQGRACVDCGFVRTTPAPSACCVEESYRIEATWEKPLAAPWISAPKPENLIHGHTKAEWDNLPRREQDRYNAEALREHERKKHLKSNWQATYAPIKPDEATLEEAERLSENWAYQMDESINASDADALEQQRWKKKIEAAQARITRLQRDQAKPDDVLKFQQWLVAQFEDTDGSDEEEHTLCADYIKAAKKRARDLDVPSTFRAKRDRYGNMTTSDASKQAIANEKWLKESKACPECKGTKFSLQDVNEDKPVRLPCTSCTDGRVAKEGKAEPEDKFFGKATPEEKAEVEKARKYAKQFIKEQADVVKAMAEN